MAEQKEFLLEVPLDASQVSDFKPDRPVKVAVYSKQGQPQEQSVKLNAEGKGSATFRFPKNRRVAAGCARAGEGFRRRSATSADDLGQCALILMANRGEVHTLPGCDFFLLLVVVVALVPELYRDRPRRLCRR